MNGYRPILTLGGRRAHAQPGLLSGAISISLLTGCGGGGQREFILHRIDAATAAAAALQQYDKNHDGKISGTELDACPALKSALGDMGDGTQDSITAEMIAERIKTWQQTSVGRMAVSCKVTRNGRPLAGAQVTLVPEPFLGPGFADRPRHDGRQRHRVGQRRQRRARRSAGHAVRLLSGRDHQAGRGDSRTIQCRHHAWRRGRRCETQREVLLSL